MLSTLAGNLVLVGSSANLIGVTITLLSMIFAGLWLWAGGFMPL
jgi:hypothetical protein